MTAAPSRTSVIRAPAFRALIVQLIAFLIVLATAWGLAESTGAQLSIAAAALLQGAVAALITRRWMRLAPWWQAIQAAFPIAIVVLGAFRLPSWIYLAAFLLLLCLYWTTFRTQVPYYPSSPAVWEAVAAMLPKDRALRIIDIGSGFGGFSMHLAAARPESEVTGIEVAPLPWLASVLRGQLRRSPARFLRGEYEQLDLGAFDAVFAYLSPAAMPALWHKAASEMAAGALLISHEFPIPEIEPDFVLQPGQGKPALHVWRIAS